MLWLNRCLALITLLLVLISPWGVLAESLDQKAQNSARQFLQNSNNLDSFLDFARAVWDKKCNPERPQSCLITECDVEPRTCRPGRILLFRGEASRHNHPGVSHFLRTRWSGSSYSLGGAQEWLNQLKKDLSLLRPMTMGPDQGDSLILVRDKANATWFYRGTDIPFKPLNKAVGDGLSLLNMLFVLHTQAAYPFFEDPQLGPRSLDPMVSFSLSPVEAYKFTDKKGGVFLVASVPRKDLYFECGEDLPLPGQFFDPTYCPEQSLFPEEMEFNAFLFVAPEYIYKSFIRERN